MERSAAAMEVNCACDRSSRVVPKVLLSLAVSPIQAVFGQLANPHILNGGGQKMDQCRGLGYALRPYAASRTFGLTGHRRESAISKI